MPAYSELLGGTGQLESTVSDEAVRSLAHDLEPSTRGLDLEKVMLRVRLPGDDVVIFNFRDNTLTPSH